jgi:hypothetical protein
MYHSYTAMSLNFCNFFTASGDEGGFEGARVNLDDGNRSWLLVEPMNSITTQSLKGSENEIRKIVRRGFHAAIFK